MQRFYKIIRPFERFENKYLILLLTLVFLLIMSGFFQGVIFRNTFFSITITLVLIAELYADSERKNFVPELLLGILALGMTWIHFYHETDRDLLLYSTISYAIYFSYATYILIWKIVRSKKVTSNIIYACITGYMLIGVLGAIFSALIEITNPGSFIFSVPVRDFRFEAFLYYSYITLTTVGYGDILPKAPTAKTLAVLLAIAGQMYMTIIMATLIGKYFNEK
jgi:hypothetical protein